MNKTNSRPIELIVCNTCRYNSNFAEQLQQPGAGLVKMLLEANLPKQICVRQIKCLSNCSKGCSIAIRGIGRWTYIYGNINPTEHLSSIVDVAKKYLNTSDGIIPWRQRPEHFRKNCVARIPPNEMYYE